MPSVVSQGGCGVVPGSGSTPPLAANRSDSRQSPAESERNGAGTWSTRFRCTAGLANVVVTESIS